MTLNEWAEEVYKAAKSKGWWDGTEGRQLTPDEILSKLMLTVSELAEAAERVRAPDFSPQELFFEGVKPDGFGVELADALIRLLDLCGRLNIDIQQIVQLKHGYNKTRPYRHGKRA